MAINNAKDTFYLIQDKAACGLVFFPDGVRVLSEEHRLLLALVAAGDGNRV